MIHAKTNRKGVVRASITADEWNALYPVGSSVVYRSVWRDPKGVETKTRSEAWTLGHGEPCVMVEGVSGGVALWALETATVRHSVELPCRCGHVRERHKSWCLDCPCPGFFEATS